MKKTLLVVDDEKLVRWTIQQSLMKENINVVSASDGIEAVEEIKKQHFDVIITDLVMPGPNGIEVARKARELSSQTKIILMTAYGTILDKKEARKGGVSHFIEKPFLVEEVRAIISQILSCKDKK